jgi:hypothetical protein
VALDAVRRRWEVQRAFFACVLNALVALEAIDAFHHVRAVLERVILFFLFESEHLGAPERGGGQQ